MLDFVFEKFEAYTIVQVLNSLECEKFLQINAVFQQELDKLHFIFG